jgi:hypothetical protein
MIPAGLWIQHIHVLTRKRSEQKKYTRNHKEDAQPDQFPCFYAAERQ